MKTFVKPIPGRGVGGLAARIAMTFAPRPRVGSRLC